MSSYLGRRQHLNYLELREARRLRNWLPTSTVGSSDGMAYESCIRSSEQCDSDREMEIRKCSLCGGLNGENHLFELELHSVYSVDAESG